MAEIEAELEFVEKIEAFGEKMVSLQPKNSGGPIVKFWDAPETITALEHVKGWLSKHAKKSLIAKKSRYAKKSRRGVRPKRRTRPKSGKRRRLGLRRPAQLKAKLNQALLGRALNQACVGRSRGR